MSELDFFSNLSETSDVIDLHFSSKTISINKKILAEKFPSFSQISKLNKIEKIHFPNIDSTMANYICNFLEKGQLNFPDNLKEKFSEILDIFGVDYSREFDDAMDTCEVKYFTFFFLSVLLVFSSIFLYLNYFLSLFFLLLSFCLSFFLYFYFPLSYIKYFLSLFVCFYLSILSHFLSLYFSFCVYLSLSFPPSLSISFKNPK